MDHLISRSPVWFGVMFTLILVELVWRVRKERGYDGHATLTTMGLVVGNIPAAMLNGIVLGAIYGAVWKAAPVHLPLNDWRTWALARLIREARPLALSGVCYGSAD